VRAKHASESKLLTCFAPSRTNPQQEELYSYVTNVEVEAFKGLGTKLKDE